MEFFQKFGVAGKEVKAFSNADLKGIGTLIVADPDFDRMDSMRLELNDFLYYGGRVIYLHTGKEFRGTWLPFPADLKTVKARQALVRDAVRDFTWGFGWNNSELYWHDEVTIPVFHNFPQDFEAVDPAVLVRAPIGLGEVILCSITPETFGNTPAAGENRPAALRTPDRRRSPHSGERDNLYRQQQSQRAEYRTGRVGIRHRSPECRPERGLAYRQLRQRQMAEGPDRRRP